MIDPEANRKLVQDQWDAFNRGDVVGAADFWAEDTRNHGRPVGRAGVLAVLRDIQATFPDVRFAPLEYVSAGEWVTARGMFSGTHRGAGRLPVNGGMLVGVEPTGRHFEVQHIHMMQVRGGKIIEHFANRNDLGMMQQLGLLPGPGQHAGGAEAIAEVIALNEAMAEALGRGDMSILEGAMAPDARINAPNNTVLTGQQALERFKKGELKHDYYERRIEEAYRSDDVVVLMGEEMVKATGTAQTHVGETVRRRFTSVWRKNNGRWQQFARQATNVGTVP